MTEVHSRNSTWIKWIHRSGKIILLIIPIYLLWWVFREVPFAQAWETIKQLEILHILLWLMLNAGLVFLMTFRWWLILRVLGFNVSNLDLARYRLGSFAISYFTPGPQFGGEPFQVLALRGQHKVPGTTGTASVSLDKLFELIANFSFLVFGTAIAFTGTWHNQDWRSAGLFIGIGLLAIPLGYLILMLTGRKPLNWLINRLPQRLISNIINKAVREVEGEISHFCIEFPRTVLTVSMVSLLVWMGLIFEYWLITHFLGIVLTIIQSITALVAARLAFLTPFPGGLGALEASQVFALETLGFTPAYGVSIALLIRMRDILFGVIGLIGITSSLGWRPTIHKKKTKDV